ncbi:predicted protein [Naegleria gruberi]|uniref:Predicted protein n=1 Tax=Naegleria gruberi TaxID=5762 RepID=D2W2J0_NAEGR|nr:uncharacterized protein NAEGRDRAFT_75604 [Naegleria gruberi]EFC36722.1 predicted protein [Naegleria gruberi]|eukprot:XP_002669466.1 predicted protein [Naegleria gruberi strain NEG-M]
MYTNENTFSDNTDEELFDFNFGFPLTHDDEQVLSTTTEYLGSFQQQKEHLQEDFSTTSVDSVFVDDQDLVDGFAALEQQEAQLMSNLHAFVSMYSTVEMDILVDQYSLASPTTRTFLSLDQNTSPESVVDQVVIGKKSSKDISKGKFEHSSFVEKRTKKAKKSEEQSIKKRAKKSSPDLWEHTKFSESAPYFEIVTDVKEMELILEVAQTKRRQNGPLNSDKNDIVHYCDLSYKIEQLDINKVNYVSLKGLLDKKTIYNGEKSSKSYTWIRLKGTSEYFFLYCQTGKTNAVHNIMSINNTELVSTRSDHLSKYSAKCSDTVRIIGPKQTKY